MPTLAQSKHGSALPHDSNLAISQVGWLGATGEVYALDDPPYDSREPGSFTPLYMAVGVWEDLGDDHFGIKD
jgi:hypothetical protein